MGRERNPWSKFYWGDHFREPTLRQCSMAAHGFWWAMLALMNESPKYGYLVMNNQPMTVAQIAKATGQNKTSVERWLAELEQHGAFSRDADGVIFSRRMARERDERAKYIANGNLGGSPILKKYRALDENEVNPPVNLEPEPEPEKEPQPEQQHGDRAAYRPIGRPVLQNINAPWDDWDGVADNWEQVPFSVEGKGRPLVAGHRIEVLARKVVEAAGFDRAKSTFDLRPLIQWLHSGIDPDHHILPTIARVAGQTGQMKITSLQYFDAAVRAAAGLPPRRA